MKSFTLFFILFLSLTNFTFAKDKFFFGVNYLQSYITYKEPSIMNEQGVLRGISGDLFYRVNNSLNLNVQGKLLSGNLEYTGATFDGTPLSQTTDDLIREYRGLVELKIKNYVPYAGYGYRYWRNDLVISYVRDTTYYYLPIGIKYLFNKFYFNYEYRHFLYGINKSFMSDVSTSRSDVIMRQNDGRGYSFEAGMIFKIKYFDLKFAAQYERWEVDDSEISNDGVDNLVEPHNSTNALSLIVGVLF